MQPVTPEVADYMKLAAAGFGYLVAAPLLGLAAAGSRWLQRLLVFLLVLIPSTYFVDSSLMIMSIEWYRGHTKGFLFSSMDVIAVALIVAALVSRRPRFSLTPPGTIPYLLFCSLCSISIFAAERPLFTLMAMVKFFKIFLVYIAAYNYLRTRADLRALLVSVAIALIVQCLIVIKMRYVDGTHQAVGMLAHQNSLSMWAYFLGLPLFAVALSKSSNKVETLIYLAGTASCGLIVVFSLSRAALAMFAFGAVVILFLSLLKKITAKRVTILTLGSAAGLLVIGKASDNIIERWATSKDSDKSGDLRWVLNRMSAKMLEDSAIGIGWNNFNVVNSRPIMRYSRLKEDWDRKRGFYANTKFYEKNPNTESLYWMYLAETGYPGFVGLIIWLGSSLWIALRAWLGRGDTLLGAFVFGIAVTLPIFYLHHGFERILTQTVNLSTFMLFLGIAARAITERKAENIGAATLRNGILYRLLTRPAGDRPPPVTPPPSPARATASQS